MQPRVSSNRSAGVTRTELLAAFFVTVMLVVVFGVMVHQARYKLAHNPGFCINNLKEIGISYKIWAEDNHDKYPFEVSVTNGGSLELAGQPWKTYPVMSNILSSPKVLTCPLDLARWPQATNFEADLKDHLSYFIGLDGHSGNPAAILSGDDNLALTGGRMRSGLVKLATNTPPQWFPGRHDQDSAAFTSVGNILLADGSVRQVTAAGLSNLVIAASQGTNPVRLALP